MPDSKTLYQQWLGQQTLDEKLRRDLVAVEGNEEAIEDLFYEELTFGTSGIRGKMGPGTARMNVHVVARATQGVAEYLLEKKAESESGGESPKELSVALAYDSRHQSREFAEVAARVLCANGIRVLMFREITPVAALSYVIRRNGLSLGIMMTASHNPKEYNGYKVYNEEGCQIVGDMPEEILAHIEKLDYFSDIKGLASSLEQSPLFDYVEDEVLEDYIREALKHSLPAGGVEELSVVYTPLHGSGNRFVTQALLKAGVGHVFKVRTQEAPDGDFPACPIPNPERIEVFREGQRICNKVNGDLILATDPDCDRVGVAVRRDTDVGGDTYWYPTGNQIGILLCNYLCENRPGAAGKTVVLSIVSSPLIHRIAAKHGVKVETTLTGFKYIGEKMEWLKDQFLFGFEESNGYLAATHVRDKDGVSAAVLIAQMAGFYKSRGMDLYDALHEIYEEHGYIREETRGFNFEGKKGSLKRKKIMEELRTNREAFYPEDRYDCLDYAEGIFDLPKADILEFVKNDSEKTIIRPSGTEPTIKAYVFARGENKQEVRHLLDEAEDIVERIMEEE